MTIRDNITGSTPMSEELEKHATSISLSSRPASSPAEAVKPSSGQQWNTKNIGLRLASDFTSGAVAGSTVAPIITIIDR